MLRDLGINDKIYRGRYGFEYVGIVMCLLVYSYIRDDECFEYSGMWQG